MASSNWSPATRIEPALTIPPWLMTATSVEPPPISTIMLPLAPPTRSPVPIAAANGSSTRATDLAPASKIESSRARFSTPVASWGIQTMISGREKREKAFDTSRKPLTIFDATSYSAITPPLRGRNAVMPSGVLPSILLADIPSATISRLESFIATTEGARRIMPLPLVHIKVLAVPRSMPNILAMVCSFLPKFFCYSIGLYLVGVTADAFIKQCGQAVDGKPHHTEIAAVNAADPLRKSSLDTVSSRLVVGLGAVQIFLKLRGRNTVNVHLCDRAVRYGNTVIGYGNSRGYRVSSSAQHGKHSLCVLPVKWFSEYLAVASYHCIGGNDYCAAVTIVLAT